MGSSLPIARLAHPLAFVAFMDSIGQPAARYLRRNSLPVYCDDPNAFVPQAAAHAFFDDAARDIDPDLGWHVGRFVGDGCMSDGLLKKIETAPTLYLGLQKLSALVRSEASHLTIGLVEREKDVMLYTHYAQRMRGFFTDQAYQIPILLSVIQHYLGRRWRPPEIGIVASDVASPCKELFRGSRILTGQEVGYLVIPRRDLRTRPPAVHVGDDGPIRFADDLRFDEVLALLLEPHLAEGYPGLKLAAELTGVSVRTLARRLAALNTSYREVIDALRFEVAQRELRNADVSITEVAQAAGFSDPAHFTRMFRRVAGVSPRQYRATLY